MMIYAGEKIAKQINKVSINGVDITKRCYYADDELGIVLCYKTNFEGGFFVGPNGYAAREMLQGDIKIEIKSEMVPV